MKKPMAAKLNFNPDATPIVKVVNGKKTIIDGNVALKSDSSIRYGSHEFMELQRGYSDCKRGIAHSSKSEHYNRGYGMRYEEEQLMENGVLR